MTIRTLSRRNRADTEPLTVPKLSRRLTAEFPCKHRLSALISKHRLNLSAQMFQADSSKPDTQLVAPRCGVLAPWLRSDRNKDKPTGLKLEATVYERCFKPKGSGSYGLAHKPDSPSRRRNTNGNCGTKPRPYPVDVWEHRYRPRCQHVCYADTAFKGWEQGMPIPKCLKCRAGCTPRTYDCPGFIPKYRTDGLSLDERMEMRKAGWDDWDDDQYDDTRPDETTRNLRMQHEAETGEAYDQVVIEGMTEEDYLMEKFGYIPSLEDFEE